MCWPSCKKGALTGAGFRRVSLDEWEIPTHPPLAKVWRRIGTPLTVAAAGQNRKRAVCGALDSASGELVRQIVADKNGATFVTLLEQVVERWPTDHLVPVMDNVSDHRSPAMKDGWNDQDPRITPCWLPAYRPDLNLIERVWRFLNRHLACHRFWTDVDALQTAAATLLDRLEAHFHAEDGPSLFLRKDLCTSA